MNRNKFVVWITLILGTVLTAQVAAEIDHQNILEEVKVTAQKRTESLQEAPLAISVLSGEQLDKQAVTSLGELVGGAFPR